MQLRADVKPREYCPVISVKLASRGRLDSNLNLVAFCQREDDAVRGLLVVVLVRFRKNTGARHRLSIVLDDAFNVARIVLLVSAHAQQEAVLACTRCSELASFIAVSSTLKQERILLNFLLCAFSFHFFFFKKIR